MSEASISGYDMQVECPECGKPDVGFNETGELVECPVFDGPASGCGAKFRVRATAEIVERGDADER